MKMQPATWMRRVEQNEFTVDEHLRLHREIEGSAYRFWLANGCDWNKPLTDWLKAENEVVVEFLSRRSGHAPARPASRRARTPATIISALPPKVSVRAPAILNGKSISTCEPKYNL
ncbi:MAG: DUF2934 domain-containing protein [Verrucomicrobiae bacterium]|nr:DUF2934 domain-containing protein [Verrucomicrobiae bacterium]